MSYHTLIFDLDDTLLDFEKGEDESLLHVFQDLPRNQIKDFELFSLTFKEINSSLWKQVSQGTLLPKLVKNLRFEELCKRLKIEVLPHELARTYEDNLGDRVHWFKGAFETLLELRARYKIAVITNGLTRVQRKKYHKIQAQSWAQSFIISEEVGLAKPDPKIFDLVLQELGSDREGTLMVGDSIPSDIVGAKNAGLDACWVNVRGGILPSEITPPKYTVSQVSEILSIL